MIKGINITHYMNRRRRILVFTIIGGKIERFGSGNYTKEEIKMCDSLLLDQV
jgi:hypothetical protein